MFLLPGSPDNILLVGFKNGALKPLTGQTVGTWRRSAARRPRTRLSSW